MGKVAIDGQSADIVRGIDNHRKPVFLAAVEFIFCGCFVIMNKNNIYEYKSEILKEIYT
jgi:hypothetical protein